MLASLIRRAHHAIEEIVGSESPGWANCTFSAPKIGPHIHCQYAMCYPTGSLHGESVSQWGSA